MMADAICGVVVAALTLAIAASIVSDVAELLGPLLLGASVNGLLGLLVLPLFVRLLRTLDPQPPPSDWQPEASVLAAVGRRAFSAGMLLVLAIIAVALALVGPGLAVFVASIGLGAALGFVCMATLIRSWERKRGKRLLWPTRSSSASRKTLYYAIPMAGSSTDA